MRTLRTLAFSLLFTVAAHAGQVDYVGEITGLVCASCKQEVVATLSKMDGVKNVEIVPSNNPEIRRITISAARDTLSADEVNQKLAAVGKEFKVTKLAKAGAQ